MWSKIQRIALVSILISNVVSPSLAYAVPASLSENKEIYTESSLESSIDPFPKDSSEEIDEGTIATSEDSKVIEETEESKTENTTSMTESNQENTESSSKTTIQQEQQVNEEMSIDELTNTNEVSESLTPEEQGYEFITNGQKMPVGSTQIEDLYSLITIKKEGVLVPEEEYSLSLVEPFKKMNYFDETSYLKIKIKFYNSAIEKEVSVPITASSGETLVLTGKESYDMGLTLLNEGGKIWLRSSDFQKNNGEKLHSGLESQGVNEYYTLKIYNKDERPYSVSRKTSDKAGSYVQSFKDQIVEEDTVIHIQYTEKEATNRLLYFQNGDEPEQTKHSGYYKVVDGKFREMAPLIEFEMPTKLKYTKERMSEQEIEKLVKNNITLKTGDVDELSFNYKKHPDISLGQDIAVVEVKWEVSPGTFMTDEFEIMFYKYDIVSKKQKVSAGTMELVDLENYVEVRTSTTILTKDQYTVKLVDTLTLKTFTHHGDKNLQVDVIIKVDGYTQRMTVPFQVLKGETLSILGTNNTQEGGFSLIKEESGLMLRASDFSSYGNGYNVYSAVGNKPYYTMNVYNPDGTLQYNFIRKGTDKVGTMYTQFEPQSLKNGSIVSLQIARNGGIEYWHDEKSTRHGYIQNRDKEYYIIENNEFKRVTTKVPTIKEVPEEIVYPKPNMADTEIKKLIKSSITLQTGSVDELEIKYLKIPDTSDQAKDDMAIIEIKTEISPGNVINDSYTIRFTFYDIKTLSKEIPVTTRKVEDLQSQIEVDTGRGSPEFSAKIEGEIDAYYFNQINTTKNLDVRVHIKETGYERVVQLPFSITAGQSMSFTGSHFRTDMGLSLIEEDNKLFLRASDFIDDGNNNVIHSSVGNNPHYRVNVHDSDGFIDYEWLRKGSDKIQDGYKKFGGDAKQIEVKEGTIISMWRTEWHTLNYWDNRSTSVRHEWIDGREKQEFYVVENNKFKRIMNVLPVYTVPEKAEYPKQNMSHKEIESFVKKQIIMQNGQVDNLTLNMTKYPDTSDITKDDTAEFDISFEIEPGKIVRYKHQLLFQYFTIQAEQTTIPLGTQVNQIKELKTLVSVTKNNEEQPFDIEILDQPDPYYFNINGESKNMKVSVSMKNLPYVRETMIPFKIVTPQGFHTKGNQHYTDMGFSLLEEDDGLIIRTGRFRNWPTSGMLHSGRQGLYYEFTFYDSMMDSTPSYTFSRYGKDNVSKGYTNFVPQKVDENTIIGIYRDEDHTLNYVDADSQSNHNFTDGRKTDYYRIENKRFVRLSLPKVPVLDDVTTLSTKVTGQTEANSFVYIRVDGVEIAVGVSDELGQFSIPIQRQKAGTKISAQSGNKVGRSQFSDTVVIQDVPAKPMVNPVFDSDTKVTGTGDPNEQLTVALNNKVLGRGTINEDGEFTISIEEQLAGVKLSVYASNSKGASEVQEIEVQLTAPNQPEVLKFTDRDVEISGTGKPGSEVEVLIGSQLYTGTVNRKKEFKIPVQMQEAGTELYVKLKNNAGESPTASSKVILTKPDSPIVLPVESQATLVKGQAKKGSIIKIYLDDKIIGESNTLKDGTFETTIPPQQYGTVLNVVAINTAGDSQPTPVTVGLVAPNAPKVNEITDNDNKIEGEGTPGAEVLIYREEKLIGQGKVEKNGKYTVTIPVQKVGTILNVYLKNTIGMSNPTMQTVILGKPLEMTVNEVTDLDDSISGVGKENASIRVFKNDKVIAEDEATDDGSFALDIPIQQADTVLKLQQQNKAGKGPVETTVVLLTAPKKPKVKQVTDRDDSVKGQGKAYTETIVTTSEGQVIGTGKSDSKGDFSVQIPVQKAYTILLVTQKNAKGISLPATIMVGHIISSKNNSIDTPLSSLTKNILSYSDSKEQSHLQSLITSNQDHILSKLPSKPKEEEVIDLEKIEEEVQRINSKLPNDKGIPGEKAKEKVESDYLLPATLSAGVSLIGLCTFLIYTFYIDKQHRDQKLFKS